MIHIWTGALVSSSTAVLSLLGETVHRRMTGCTSMSTWERMKVVVKGRWPWLRDGLGVGR